MKSLINSKNSLVYFFIGLISLSLWWVIYSNLQKFSQFLTYDVFKIQQKSHLGESIAFFVYDTPKVLMLLVLVVFGVGIIRSFFTPEFTRSVLSGKSEFMGNILAALLGIVTPFCSCSAVPLFIGFVSAGVPLGVTFSFLISAPMINEVAVGLLYGLLGFKIAGLYVLTGLFIAIISGFIIGKLKLENYIEDWVKQTKTVNSKAEINKLSWEDRLVYGKDAVKEIVGRTWPYVIAGIAVGAGIHGYVPQDLMASIMGKQNFWGVPLAVLIGVPMYSGAAGIIPVVEALLGKGAALGTTLAFMMSVIALSLPEMVMLKRVLKLRLIFIFIGILSFGILFVGYLFNLII